MRVGPESSGANPGPVCYGYDGYLSITDANLILGRLNAEYFPKIFGKNNNEGLNLELTRSKFEEITQRINETYQKLDPKNCKNFNNQISLKVLRKSHLGSSKLQMRTCVILSKD
jgi:N-methylhydantoinase A/oxoprolinase/acetone carboxylase beta subunit